MKLFVSVAHGYPTTFNSWIDAKTLVQYKGLLHANRIINRRMTAEAIEVRNNTEDDATDAHSYADDDDVASIRSRWHLFDIDCPKAEILYL